MNGGLIKRGRFQAKKRVRQLCDGGDRECKCFGEGLKHFTAFSKVEVHSCFPWSWDIV